MVNIRNIRMALKWNVVSNYTLVQKDTDCYREVRVCCELDCRKSVCLIQRPDLHLSLLHKCVPIKTYMQRLKKDPLS